MSVPTTTILTSNDLGSYFFNELDRINSRQAMPLDMNVLLYCSEVLSEHSKIHRYFDSRDNRYHEKVLGISLLNAMGLDSKARFRKLKEVADTSLIVCGYFVESIDRRILGVNYYKKVGMIAFLELDKISPDYLDQPSFFKSIVNIYDYIINTFQVLRASQSPQDKKDILNILPSVNNSES